jgi:hypothetical protein
MAELINGIIYLATNLENLKLISLIDMNFSKSLGKERVYSYNSNLVPTESKEIMIRNNTHLYEFIFTAQKDEFEKFSSNINRIIDSFYPGIAKLE